MANINSTAAGGLIGTGLGAATGNPLLAQLGGSLGGLAGSMFGGDSGVSDDAVRMLREAQARIMAIQSPTAQDLKLILAPLVQKGVLTPEQYQTIQAQPTAFTSINLDPTSREAETGALNQLQDIANKGGMDANFRNAMNEARNTSAMQAKGSRDAILQNAAERGVLNSNLTAADQLAQAATDAYGLNASTTQAAADAENRALQAIMNSANLGSTINNQDYQQASDRAKAIDAINSYNAQNSQNQANLNTQASNAAQEYNLNLAQNIAQYNNQNQNRAAEYNAAIPETIFDNKLRQAGAAAGVALPAANLAQKGYENTNATQGALIGNIGTGISNYANNQSLARSTPSGSSSVVRASTAPNAASVTPSFQAPQYAQADQKDPFNGNPFGIPMATGGEVPGEPRVPGDSPLNDTVPARLSPGEIVVPRSVASNPLKLADFVRNVPRRTTPTIHPDDVSTVLHALTKIRRAAPTMTAAARG